MRNATLAEPPIFRLESQVGAHLTLASDTTAVAHIFVLETDIIRLVVLPHAQFRHPRSWTVAPGQEDTPLEGRDRFDLSGFRCPPFALDASDPLRLRVETDRLRLEIALENLSCRWSVCREDAWIAMAEDRPTQAYNFGWWGEAVRHYLRREPGEQYFGLGERSGALNRAGRRFRLSNLDAMGYDAKTSDPLYKHIPFYITRRPQHQAAIGLFYDTLSDCSFDFGCEHSNYHGPYRKFDADHGDLDLYVMAGPEVGEIVRRFTWLTGRPMATPLWALGFSGSTMSYTDAPDADAQMAGFLDKVAQWQIPCQSFHLSSGYTSIGAKRYVFTWNRDKFPDPEASIARFNQAGVKLIANIKPALLTDHPQYQAAAQQGLFLHDAEGKPVLEQFWDFPGSYLDFTNPAAIAWWQEQVKTALLDLGIAATWNDNNEYEVENPKALAHGFGRPFPAAEMKPLQTLLMLRASKAAQCAHAPDRPPFLVSRAGAAGMQRYAQTWSGDNFTSWETLKWNIPMGLGLALSGVSNSGHDIGGFAGPRPEPELFLRWIGFGVFLPRFSIHSWNSDRTVNEPWMYEDRMAEVQALMRLRQTLIPYLAHLLDRYRQAFEPVTRPLFYDFPNEETNWAEETDFMLGSAVLVAPVIAPGQRERQVRLPLGADWTDYWRGAHYEGGQVVTVPAPLDRPPFFLRLGDRSADYLAKAP